MPLFEKDKTVTRGLAKREAVTTARPHGYYADQRRGQIPDSGGAAGAVGAGRLVAAAADLEGALIAKGMRTGKSDRNILKQVGRARALFAGKETPSAPMNPRSFSAQPAVAGGLEANWEAQMRQTTNSFFRGNTGWWDRSMAAREAEKNEEALRLRTFDKVTGLPVRHGFSSLGPNVGDDASEKLPGPAAININASRYNELQRLGAGGVLFDTGYKSALDNMATETMWG